MLFSIKKRNWFRGTVQAPYLQQAEIEELLRSIPNTRDRLLAQFLYESGCSVSDVIALKSNAIHGDGTVHFSKRSAQISQQLAQELLSNAGTYIFSTRQTPTITAKRVQQILKPLLARYQKRKHTPHVLRYSHVVHAYLHGVSLHAISKQTGLSAQRLAQILEHIQGKQYSIYFSGKGGRHE